MNKNVFKYLVLAFASLLFIFSIAMWAQSFSFYSDEWGTSIDFDKERLIGVLGSLAILVGIAISLFNTNRNTRINSLYWSGITVTALYCCYDLAAFFKPLSKDLGRLVAGKEPKNFSFVELQEYLYTGILFGLLLAILVVKFIEYKKANKKA